MTEIKRFDMRGNTWPSDDGSIVSYKDHAAIVAALQEQVRALAAENASMKLSLETQEVSDELQDLLNDTVQLDSDSDGCQSWTWVDNADKVILTILGAIKPKTPVTDAVLREIRAQGAIDARNALVVTGDGADIYAVVTNVAARIRSGEQP